MLTALSLSKTASYPLALPLDESVREVIEAAGLEIVESRFSDRYGLFHQYLCKPV